MTKNEFILQAIISMAGKVIGSNGITESGEWSRVVHEAYELAEAIEESRSSYGFPYFDTSDNIEKR